MADMTVTKMTKQKSGSVLRGGVLTFAALTMVASGAELRGARAFEQSVQARPPVSQLPALQGIEISPPSGNRGAGVELTLPSTTLGGNAANQGSGLSIPGLGNLPKLDFGLELLYGSPEQLSPAPDQSDALPNALTVHGEVKKTF